MANEINGYYFLDANIWMESLLERGKNNEVNRLLTEVDDFKLGISDFSLHSIGVVLSKNRKPNAISKFTNDLFLEGHVRLFRLNPSEIFNLIGIQNDFNLDFDDAYQYKIVASNKLQLVSFDKDFDKTDIVRKTPALILEELKI